MINMINSTLNQGPHIEKNEKKKKLSNDKKTKFIQEKEFSIPKLIIMKHTK